MSWSECAGSELVGRGKEVMAVAGSVRGGNEPRWVGGGSCGGPVVREHCQSIHASGQPSFPSALLSSLPFLSPAADAIHPSLLSEKGREEEIVSVPRDASRNELETVIIRGEGLEEGKLIRDSRPLQRGV